MKGKRACCCLFRSSEMVSDRKNSKKVSCGCAAKPTQFEPFSEADFGAAELKPKGPKQTFSNTLAQQQCELYLEQQAILGEEIKELDELLFARRKELEMIDEKIQKIQNWKPCSKLEAILGSGFDRSKHGGDRETSCDNSILGLKWEEIGSEKPKHGKEIKNAAISKALQYKLEFSIDEFEKFEVVGLSDISYIKSGNTYFKPTEEDDFYEEEEEEQEEPAPPQPEDLTEKEADAAGEIKQVFDVVQKAMAVLRLENENIKKQNELNPKKRQMSLLDRCFFNVRDYISRLVASMPTRDSSSTDKRKMIQDIPSEWPTNIIAGGSTQMGKTMFVTIGYLAAWFAECPLVCITTTVAGTKSLHNKVLDSLKRMEEYGAKNISTFCMYLYGITPEQLKYFQKDGDFNKADIARAGLGGYKDAPNRGILFIADTASQMQKAVLHIEAVRKGGIGSGVFALLVDEADSMQRSKDEHLKLEQRLKDLKGQGEGFEVDQGPTNTRVRCGAKENFPGPCLILSISATLLPVLLKMYKAQQAAGNGANPQTVYTFFTKAPPSKYVGVLSEVWQPFLRNKDGNPQETFLGARECTGPNLGGILEGHYKEGGVKLKVDGAVLALFADACAMELSLLLDITVSRVNVEGASLQDKAEWLGKYFEDKNLAVITVDGKLIRYKTSGQQWDAESWVSGFKRKDVTVEGLLNQLEFELNGAPVAIFGYSQMIRGDSFRSKYRVPTHMVQMLSNAMSVDRLVQSAGRSSFLGKELLEINATETPGGKAGHVRVLMTCVDYWTVRAYVEFMNLIAKEITAGKSVEELFDPTKRGDRKYLPQFSILVGDLQRRTIGNRNERLDGALDKGLFEEDCEAHFAFAVSEALKEAEAQEKKAIKRHATACDEKASLTKRILNAGKCASSAIKTRKEADGAQENAAKAVLEASKHKRDGVRPSKIASFEAEDAALVASSVEALAAEATATVWLAEIYDDLDRVEKKLKAIDLSKKGDPFEKVIEGLDDLMTATSEDGLQGDIRWAVLQDKQKKHLEQRLQVTCEPMSVRSKIESLINEAEERKSNWEIEASCQKQKKVDQRELKKMQKKQEHADDKRKGEEMQERRQQELEEEKPKKKQDSKLGRPSKKQKLQESSSLVNLGGSGKESEDAKEDNDPDLEKDAAMNKRVVSVVEKISVEPDFQRNIGSADRSKANVVAGATVASGNVAGTSDSNKDVMAIPGSSCPRQEKKRSPFSASEPQPGEDWMKKPDPRSKENPPKQIWVAKPGNDIEALSTLLVVERAKTSVRFMCTKCHLVFWGSKKAIKHHMRGPIALGSRWEHVSPYCSQVGTEIRNDALASGLLQKLASQEILDFSKQELDSFKMPDISCDSYIKAGDNYFKPCGQVQDKVATVKICVKSLTEEERRVFFADDMKTPQKGTSRAKSPMIGDTLVSGKKDQSAPNGLRAPGAVRGGAARGRGRGAATGRGRGKSAPKSTLTSIFDNDPGSEGVAIANHKAAEQDLHMEVDGGNG